jgi:hypothetical protein
MGGQCHAEQTGPLAPQIITLATRGKNEDIDWPNGEMMAGGSSWHVDMGYATKADAPLHPPN